MFLFVLLCFLGILQQQNHVLGKIHKNDISTYSVVETIPHDSDCYTQGLTFNEGYLYESCGINGKSSVRKVNPATGEVLQQLRLEKSFFAEGLAVIGNYIYVLTWTNMIMLVIDKTTFKLKGKYRYETHTGEGWGLTYNGKHFIVSDGSSRISFFEVPDIDKYITPVFPYPMLKKVKTIIVRDANNNEVKLLNELEWLGDKHVYSNVWYKDFVLKINTDDGSITEMLDLHSLYPYRTRSKTADCLNGIAYNRTDDTYLLTGKLWPQYYKINVMPLPRKVKSIRLKNSSGVVDL